MTTHLRKFGVAILGTFVALLLGCTTVRGTHDWVWLYPYREANNLLPLFQLTREETQRLTTLHATAILAPATREYLTGLCHLPHKQSVIARREALLWTGIAAFCDDWDDWRYLPSLYPEFEEWWHLTPEEKQALASTRARLKLHPLSLPS